MIKDLSREGECVISFMSIQDFGSQTLSPGEYRWKLHWPHCGLRPGVYSAKVNLTEGPHFYMLDIVESFKFVVNSNGKMTQCVFNQPRSWDIQTVHNS